VNERIRAKEVRVIGEDGKQIGVMGLREALQLAYGKGLDLVEVAPDVDPPVCKIMDYGRYKYEQQRKAKDARKKQASASEIKEMQMKVGIGEHDYGFKIRQLREFLEGRKRARVFIKVPGRLGEHPELVDKFVKRIISELEDIGVLEQGPVFEEKMVSITFAPRK
jgi:translation initiation factor IF-3